MSVLGHEGADKLRLPLLPRHGSLFHWPIGSPHETCARSDNRETGSHTIPTHQSMANPIAVHGHEIIDLVSACAEGIRLSQLAEAVTERFGTSQPSIHAPPKE